MSPSLTFGVDTHYERTGEVATLIVGGVMIATFLSYAASATMTVTNCYMQLAPNVDAAHPVADLSAIQFRAPRAFSFSSLFFNTSGTPTGSQTYQLQFCVNGSPASEIVAVITAGNYKGGASGVLAVNEDDLVCLYASFTGGATTCGIRSATAGYLMLPVA